MPLKLILAFSYARNLKIPSFYQFFIVFFIKILILDKLKARSGDKEVIINLARAVREIHVIEGECMNEGTNATELPKSFLWN